MLYRLLFLINNTTLFIPLFSITNLLLWAYFSVNFDLIVNFFQMASSMITHYSFDASLPTSMSKYLKAVYLKICHFKHFGFIYSAFWLRSNKNFFQHYQTHSCHSTYDYLKICYFEHFAAIFKHNLPIYSQTKNFISSRILHHMVTKIHVKIRKIVRAVWPKYLKTCHFEHFETIVSMFQIFAVKQNFFSSSGHP